MLTALSGTYYVVLVQVRTQKVTQNALLLRSRLPRKKSRGSLVTNGLPYRVRSQSSRQQRRKGKMEKGGRNSNTEISLRIVIVCLFLVFPRIFSRFRHLANPQNNSFTRFFERKFFFCGFVFSSRYRFYSPEMS